MKTIITEAGWAVSVQHLPKETLPEHLARALNIPHKVIDDGRVIVEKIGEYVPVYDWKQGGDLIQKYGVALRRHSSDAWYAMTSDELGGGERASWSKTAGGDRYGIYSYMVDSKVVRFSGLTPLEAAVRTLIATFGWRDPKYQLTFRSPYRSDRPWPIGQDDLERLNNLLDVPRASRLTRQLGELKIEYFFESPYAADDSRKSFEAVASKWYSGSTGVLLDPLK